MHIEESSILAFLATWPLPTLGVGVLFWALVQRPWLILRREALQHAWLGSLVFLTLLWSARATVGEGVVIQLMGASLAVTMFGLPLAMVTLAIVDVVSLLGLAYLSGRGWAQIDWVSLVPRFFWMALVPGALTAALQAALRRWVPRHPFVFILGHGYFSALVAAVVAGGLRAIWQVRMGVVQGGLGLADSLTGAVIIAFGEAFLTGMLVAIFVVYRPQWLVTFDEGEYLRGR